MNELTLSKQQWLTFSKQQRRDAIMDLEQASRDITDECGIEPEMKHFICNGIYAREMTAPKDATLVGEIHLKPCLNTISKGSILVFTESGVKTITAPHTFISPAGTKRAGYVLEEVTWTTYHATEETELENIRREVVTTSYNSLNKQLEKDDDLDCYSGNSYINATTSESAEKSSEAR